MFDIKKQNHIKVYISDAGYLCMEDIDSNSDPIAISPDNIQFFLQNILALMSK